MFFVVLPIVGLGSVTRTAPISAALVEHLIFGLATGVGFLPFQLPLRVTRQVRQSV